jgi:fructokinase
LIHTNNLYGGIEAGGTKFICAVSNAPPSLSSEIHFETTVPQETLEKVCEYFFPFVKDGQIRSIGVAAFGPVDTDIHSPTYGFITATPKPNWQNTDILGFLQRELGVPFAFHHDVSVSAIGENKWGASQGLNPSLYLTIGTGIGGGYLIDGKPLTGLSALEMGHISIPHDLEKDPFAGNCPYHGDCFEGLAAGPAIFSRIGKRGESIPDSNPFWLIEADYISHALVNYILTLSPRIIVIGGGVMQRTLLYDIVRQKVREILNGYLKFDILAKEISSYIVPPALGKYSGVLGAISMAMDLDKTIYNQQ